MLRVRLNSVLALAGLAAILIPTALSAQVTFQRVYGGSANDEGLSVQPTADGGYVITGSTMSYGAGGGDVYLIKTNANGDTLWTRAYGGTDYDAGYSVQQTLDGGYIIAGETWSFSIDGDVYLIKTDADGDTLWTRALGGGGDGSGWSVQQTIDSGYIIAGYVDTSGSGMSDVYLMKTNASGDTLWTKAYGGSEGDGGLAVEQTTDSGYIIVGGTASFGAGSGDIYVIKTDPVGDTVWTMTYGGTGFDLGMSVQQTVDGGYILAGATRSFGEGGEDVYLIKTDADGDTLWTRTCGDTADERANSIQQIIGGGYIVAGRTASFGVGGDVYLIMTSAAGDTQWTKTFGGGENDGGNSVRQTADKGYVIGGSTRSFGAGGGDVYLIKTDSLGEVPVFVAEPKADAPRGAVLELRCEPNPFAGVTRISLASRSSGVEARRLRVCDVQGRVVRSYSISPSPFSLTWDGTDELGRALPSGTYFITLDAAGQHTTVRVVLQR
jgi:hypothetical protein